MDLTGDLMVDHDGYVTDLNVSNLQATIDMVQGEVTDLTGSIDGVVQIPNFLFPAEFSLEGLGPNLDVLVQASLSFFGFGIGL